MANQTRLRESRNREEKLNVGVVSGSPARLHVPSRLPSRPLGRLLSGFTLRNCQEGAWSSAEASTLSRRRFLSVLTRPPSTASATSTSCRHCVSTSNVAILEWRGLERRQRRRCARRPFPSSPPAPSYVVLRLISPLNHSYPLLCSTKERVGAL